MESDLFYEIMELFEELNCDDCAPKMVRLKIKKICNMLTNCNDPVSIRIDKSLQELDDLGEDANLPIHVKTQIWNIVSRLESIPQ